MNTLTNVVLISISILIVNWYVKQIEKRYGKKRSIPASVNELHRSGGMMSYYIFLALGIILPMFFMESSVIITIACFIQGFIWGVPIITPTSEARKLENNLYISSLNFSLLLLSVGICITSPWLIVLFIACLGYVLYLYAAKPKHYMWDIQVFAINAIWVSLIIDQFIK